MSQLVVFTMIQYKISPKNLNSHLFSVELSFATQVGKVYHLSLPAWLPGSYMIRDFAKNIVEISAQSETQQNSENKADMGNYATNIIFLDLSISQCIINAKNRPWEPHKYSSKQAQDDNLDMLITWIKDYDTRVDTFSKHAHQKFYENFQGTKKHITKLQ